MKPLIAVPGQILGQAGPADKSAHGGIQRRRGSQGIGNPAEDRAAGGPQTNSTSHCAAYAYR